MVTDANLNYVGSITIDAAIMAQVQLRPYEKVQVANNNNGARLETYAIPGEADSGVICLNGAAARLAQKGDIVIIMAYALLSEAEWTDFSPLVALMDSQNRIQKLLSGEQAGSGNGI